LKKEIPAILLMLLVITGSREAEGPRGALERIDSYRVAFEQFFVKVRITTYKRGQIDKTSLFHVYVNGNRKSLAIAKKHETRGMKVLYVDENMWVHLPGTRRPIRITPIQRLMGQASNGDLARVNYSGDYTAEMAGAERIGAIPCKVFDLRARSEAATYHRIKLWARSSDYRPVKAEYYLSSGKHVKTAFFEKYRQAGGKVLLERITIVDELRKDQKTTLEYLTVEERKLPSKYFNKNYLVHVSGL